MRHALALAGALLGLAGCGLLHHPRVSSGEIHYVVGRPYESDGVWHYPRAQFDLDETGLAVRTTRESGLTADGEVADPDALAAAHPTLQLPAIARVTNLDTGLQVLVRVNDRGPAQRGRAIALTPRAFELLGGAGQPVMRVRIQVEEPQSQQLAARLGAAEVPVLKLATAPTGKVTSESLAPPPGVTQEATRAVGASPPPVAGAPVAAAPAVPLRLPEQVWRVSAHPGPLYVDLGTFTRPEYAIVLQTRMAWLGATAVADYDAPGGHPYRVRIGPLTTVAAADAMLTRCLRAGIADARIVAE